MWMMKRRSGDLVAATLPKIDCEVLSAGSGEDAVKIAKKEKPDLIMMDVSMPGRIDGLQATRLIKNDPATKDCFIIMLTSLGADSGQTKGLRSRRKRLLRKAFQPTGIIKKS